MKAQRIHWLCMALMFICFLPANSGNTVEFNRHWNRARGYEPFAYATPSEILIDNTSDKTIKDYFKLPDSFEDIQLIFRAQNSNSNPNKKYPYYTNDGAFHTRKNPKWGFFFTTQSSDTIKIVIDKTETDRIIGSKTVACITLYTGKFNTPREFIIENGVDCYSGVNQWKFTAGKGTISLFAGNRKYNKVFETDLAGVDFTGFGFICESAGAIMVSDISVNCHNPKINSADTDYLSRLNDPNRRKSSLEGKWMVFDRTLEESLLKMGGNYQLGLIKEGKDYVVIYLDGATINKSEWISGKIKGRLIATPFKDVFDVEWIDAEGEILSKDIKAQIEDNDILTIQFPYHSSQLRLRKIP